MSVVSASGLSIVSASGLRDAVTWLLDPFNASSAMDKADEVGRGGIEEVRLMGKVMWQVSWSYLVGGCMGYVAGGEEWTATGVMLGSVGLGLCYAPQLVQLWRDIQADKAAIDADTPQRRLLDFLRDVMVYKKRQLQDVTVM